jgi:ATP10 protein
MKAINKEAGKVPHALAGQLVPAHKAQRWPQLLVSMGRAEENVNLSEMPKHVKARVILARYRQSAEMYLGSWRNCTVKAFAVNPDVDLVELNMIDLMVCSSKSCTLQVQHTRTWIYIGHLLGVQHVVRLLLTTPRVVPGTCAALVTDNVRWQLVVHKHANGYDQLWNTMGPLTLLQIAKYWPMKGMLVNAKRPKEVTCEGHIKPVQHAFFFGDVNKAASDLGMTNRLSGYVFVLDANGLIRWRASGKLLNGEGLNLIKSLRSLCQQ